MSVDDALFEIEAERLVHRGAIVDFVELDIRAPDGEQITRDVIHHPGAVAVVAIDDSDRVALVRQFRAPMRASMIEIPAGKLDVAGEEPLTTAQRELLEEVGVSARHWVHLTTCATTPGFSDELLHIYLARNLEPAKAEAHGIEEEHMVLTWTDRVELLAAIRDRSVTDAKTIIGVLMATAHVGDTGGP